MEQIKLGIKKEDFIYNVIFKENGCIFREYLKQKENVNFQILFTTNENKYNYIRYCNLVTRGSITQNNNLEINDWVDYSDISIKYYRYDNDYQVTINKNAYIYRNKRLYTSESLNAEINEEVEKIYNNCIEEHLEKYNKIIDKSKFKEDLFYCFSQKFVLKYHLTKKDMRFVKDIFEDCLITFLFYEKDKGNYNKIYNLESIKNNYPDLLSHDKKVEEIDNKIQEELNEYEQDFDCINGCFYNRDNVFEDIYKIVLFDIDKTDGFKKYENDNYNEEYKKYLDKYGEDKIIDLSQDLEERLLAYNRGEIELTEEEKEYSEIYNLVMSYYDKDLIDKRTHKLKKIILKSDEYLDFVKKFFDLMEKYDILIKEDNKFRIYSTDKMEDFFKELKEYY